MLVIREISKVIMFTLMWGMPILLAYLFKNTDMLWFYALTFVCTFVMFGHYEDIAKEETSKEGTI